MKAWDVWLKIDKVWIFCLCYYITFNDVFKIKTQHLKTNFFIGKKTVLVLKFNSYSDVYIKGVKTILKLGGKNHTSQTYTLKIKG